MMRLINRDTDYAVRALSAISRYPDQWISVSDLVEMLDVPKPFLRKILQKLQVRGVLASNKGKKGGFSLKRSAESIYLLELLEIFHGKFEVSDCFVNKNLCSDMSTCILKTKVSEIKKYIVKELQSITLASLLPQSIAPKERGCHG